MKSSMMNPGDSLFQIEIVEPRKRVATRRLIYDGESILKTGGKIIKYDDVPMPAPTRTLLKYFRNGESARKWGRRFGTVLACFKVDKTNYLENIEHLNLMQEPLSIGLQPEGFTIASDLTVSRAREKDYNIEIH